MGTSRKQAYDVGRYNYNDGQRESNLRVRKTYMFSLKLAGLVAAAFLTITAVNPSVVQNGTIMVMSDTGAAGVLNEPRTIPS